MKIYILIATLLIAIDSFSQTPKQGLKILLKEKTKGDAEIRVKNAKVTVRLNDSINHIATTDNEGMLNIETQTGKFSVSIIKDSCQTITMTGINVGENKRSYLTFELTCTRYINSLTKKEFKKLGYKRVDAKKD